MKQAPAGSFYRHIIREGWAIVRGNPALWIFGFFVAFLGNGGIYELLIQGTGRLGLRQDFGGYAALIGILPSGPELLRGFRQLDTFTAVSAVLFALALIGLVALAIWAVVSSQGALLTGVRDASRGRRLSFVSLFNTGNEVCWPLAALNLLSRAAIASFFYLLLSLLVLLLAKATALNAVLYLLAFLVIIPLTLVIGFVTIYAAAYIALYRMRFVEAVETAVALFRTYWLISLETALILFAFNVAVALALALAIIALAAAFFVVFGLLAAAATPAAWIFLAVTAFLMLALFVAAGAGLAAFQYAVWTLVFLKLNQRGHGAVAKIVRWLERLLGSR